MSAIYYGDEYSRKKNAKYVVVEGKGNEHFRISKHFSKITFLPEHGFQLLVRVWIAADSAVIGAESDADKAFLMADADQADDGFVVTRGDLNEIVNPHQKRKTPQPLHIDPPSGRYHIGVPIPERRLLLLGVKNISPKILHHSSQSSASGDSAGLVTDGGVLAAVLLSPISSVSVEMSRSIP